MHTSNYQPAPDQGVTQYFTCGSAIRKSAFTLIELLTVIAIIGILAAIIIPTVGKVRQTAQRSACASNLRQIGIATFNYAADNKDWLPGYEQRTDGNSQYYGLETSATPKGWVGGGQLVYYLNPYLGAKSTGSPVLNRIFVCPGNTEVKDSFAKAKTTDGGTVLAAYYIGAKARLRTSTTMKRPIGLATANTRSVKIADIENPKAAVYLFDLDVEMGSVGMTNQSGAAIVPSATSGLPLTAVHGNTRNVLYYDAHVQTIDKTIDPHEK